MAKQDIGLIGLAVMGENLVLNMESHGFSVAVYNRTTSRVDDFVNGRAKGKNIKGCHSIEDLMDSLQKPRKIMLMVKAGKPVDDFIELLIPHLDAGDIVIDGGNESVSDIANINRCKSSLCTGQREYVRCHFQQPGKAVQKTVARAKDNRRSETGYSQAAAGKGVQCVLTLTLGAKVKTGSQVGIGI